MLEWVGATTKLLLMASEVEVLVPLLIEARYFWFFCLDLDEWMML